MSTQPQKGWFPTSCFNPHNWHLSCRVEGFHGSRPVPTNNAGIFSRLLKANVCLQQLWRRPPSNGMWRGDCCNVDLWLKGRPNIFVSQTEMGIAWENTHETPPWVWNFQICRTLNDVRFTMTRPLADTSWRSRPETRNGVWHSMKAHRRWFDGDLTVICMASLGKGHTGPCKIIGPSRMKY